MLQNLYISGFSETIFSCWNSTYFFCYFFAVANFTWSKSWLATM